MRLAVELHGTTVGTIDGDARTFDFVPSDAALAQFGVNSTALSVAIPFVLAPQRHHAARRRNWFAELLPEGDQYEYMINQGAIRRGDTPAFLARYGRDVAGALQIWDIDDPTEPRTPALEPVDSSGIRDLLRDPIGSPLGNATGIGRTSLGGVQPKILLARTETGWAQAVGGHPTTHILKPRLDGDHATMIFDEEYGSRLARAVGLASFDTWIDDFNGVPAIVIERYDRRGGERIHQEDFNQALGASGNQKYQELGGVVSLRRIADTVQRNTPAADLQRLARMTVLTAGIGNLDMHAKNLSLLHNTDGEVRLAPAYDIVPQASRQGRLALAINGEYRHAAITRADLEQEITSWGVRRSNRVVGDALDELKNALSAESPLPDARTGIREQIGRFVTNLQEGAAVGEP